MSTRRPARRSSSRDLALIATFTGVVAALGLVPAVLPPGIPVPITAQSLGVMLAGSVLGARRGFGALLLFLVLVAIGLPLLAGGRGGLGVFAGPSVGFLLAYPVCAGIIGWLVERGGPSYRLGWGVVANALGGIVVLYAAGTAGLMAVTHLGLGAAVVANGWYVVGDAVKVVIAAVVARGVHSAYPGLLGGPRQRDRASSTA
jgi:biotin transport system substrate-specific component